MLIFICFIKTLQLLQELQYELINYEYIQKLAEKIQKNSQYKDFIKIENLIQKYFKEEKLICDLDKKTPCHNFSFTLTDFTATKEQLHKRPQVLIIGGKHGNEVTGINSIVRFIESVLELYYQSNVLYSLLQNIRLVLVPAINTQGFANQIREEIVEGNKVDTNWDFPYNWQDNFCFKTFAGKLLDKLYRDNVFIGTITFHGGDNSITYPWGSFSHRKNCFSDDDLAFKKVAEILRDTADRNEALKIEQYSVGNIHNVVYDVYGGFEDWAYGGSWDKQFVTKKCKNYSKNIHYKDESLWSLVFLIEAGFDKIPQQNTLGNQLSVFMPDQNRAVNGHVSRNMRIIIAFSQIFQPVVEILEILPIEQSQAYEFKILVTGCLSLSSIQINDQDVSIQEITNKLQKIEAKLSYFGQNKKRDQNLQIGIICDQKYFDEEKYPMPQSHFLWLRTQSNYQIITKNNEIESQSKMNFIFQDININNYQGNSCYQFSLYEYKCEQNKVILFEIDQEQFEIIYENKKPILSNSKGKNSLEQIFIQYKTLDIQMKKIVLDFPYEVFRQLKYDNFYLIKDNQQLKGNKLEYFFNIRINSNQIQTQTNYQQDFFVVFGNNELQIELKKQANNKQASQRINTLNQILSNEQKVIIRGENNFKVLNKNQNPRVIFQGKILEEISQPQNMQQKAQQRQKQNQKQLKIQDNYQQAITIIMIFLIIVFSISGLLFIKLKRKQSQQNLTQRISHRVLQNTTELSEV